MKIIDKTNVAEAALDVYDGEFERPPDARLWDDERVLITPHVSAATDVSEHGGMALFCENLSRYLEGWPLKNLIDWESAHEIPSMSVPSAVAKVGTEIINTRVE